MKELNNFRQFLNEGTWGGKKPKNPNTDIPWGGKDPKNPIKDIPWGGKDPKNPAKDIPWGGNKGDKEVTEGTWSVGSEKEMIKALSLLDKISQMGGVKGSVELDKLDSMLYRIFGDDEFHDAIDRAKDGAIDDDQFANALGDARWIGLRFLKKEQGMKESLEENSRMEFEITPEYLFDAAIQYIQDDYDGASLHVAPDGTTDDFYDGDKHTFTIKSKEQAEDIIDNFEAQMVKTAQNDWEDEQDAMYGKSSFVEEEGLSENDKTLDELLNGE